jgi:hypothetical protein
VIGILAVPITLSCRTLPATFIATFRGVNSIPLTY